MTHRAAEAHALLGEAYRRVGEYCLPIIEFALAKLFMDYKVWDAIPDQGDIGISELAEKVGGTPDVIERLTTFFVSSELLTMPSPGRVAHTKRSHDFQDWRTDWREGFASPRDNKNTPFGWTFGIHDKPVHEILVAGKPVRDGFTDAMHEVGPMYSLKGIYDISWVKEGIKPERPIFVDIGGSHGIALKDIVTTNDFIPAEQVVLFDLPGVSTNTKRNIVPKDTTLQKVQLYGGNIFEPYPKEVHGAQIYHIRRVLNSYPDDDVVQALQNVRKVAAPDSRLIIVEELLSPQRNQLNVIADILLMCCAGKRRSAAQFNELAGRGGFRFRGQYDNIKSEWDDFSVLEYVVIWN
ncbi:putative O-methyltransferase [Xylariales sp. PMI_506]|nr:putative O-methyltransferase [Xylariales sp. PMI_506]